MTAAIMVSVFGSTGSVGKAALDVISHANAQEPGRFRVVALAAGSDIETLAAQARVHSPEIVVISQADLRQPLEDKLPGLGIEVAAGEQAAIEAASRPVDRFLAAIVGSAGLSTTLAAARAGNDIALANKESIVMGGPLLLAEARRSGARIIPVDSEHSAIFQCLGNGKMLERLTITASGGPFRKASREEMSVATPQQAAAHPNWSMGTKISIDSATLMNKALELIEASLLFEIHHSRIDVLVHPQSIVHGMAHFADGSVIAQLGTPDMRTPISLALGWPDRVETLAARLDLASIGRLDFGPVDSDRFPAINLARRALEMGSPACGFFNAVNDSAVASFIAGKCGLLDIPRAVAAALDRFSSSDFISTTGMSLETIKAIESLGREFASEFLRVAAD